MRRVAAPAIWGPGAPEISRGTAWVDGVLVLEGRRAHEWRGRLAELTGSSCSPDVAERVEAELRRYVKRRDEAVRVNA